MADMYEQNVWDNSDGNQRYQQQPGIQAPYDPNNPVTPQPPPATTPPAPKKNYLEGNMGFDPTKLADPNKQTEKYQIARVFQNYDPAKGLQQEGLMDELNKLGIGEFYAESGDRLGIRNPTGGNRLVAGVGDVITNYTGEGAKSWAPLMTGDGGAPAGGQTQGPGSLMSGMINPQATQTPGAAQAPGLQDSTSGQGLTIVQTGGAGDPFGGNGVKLSNGNWVPKDHPLAQQAAGTPAAAPGAAPGAPAEDNRAKLMRILSERMGQGTDIDANNPVIKNQVDNYSATQERAKRTFLDQNAERAAAQGLASSGSVNATERQANEQAGLNTANFQSELIGRELQSRRQEIQHALDSMGAQLTEGERQALQRELAAADNALKRYGIDTQNSQFYAGLSQADRHFLQQMAQQDKFGDRDDAFRWAGLNQSGNQFTDQMGFNTADRQAYWDAVRRGLV